MNKSAEGKAPKGLVYVPSYQPDMAKMVSALKVVLEYTPVKKSNTG